MLHNNLPIVPQSHLPRLHPTSFSPFTVDMSHRVSFDEPSYAASIYVTNAAAPSTAPTDDIDIPMPTSVSVLLRTQGEFILPYDVDSSHAPIEAILPIESGFLPAPVSSDTNLRPYLRA